MLTSTQIRQQFLDFFREKKHTIVPSSSLMPDSPNLLFTNAGMNQFVPIFLGERAADVSKWAGAIPFSDTRAADTQKCIRAGGKHNDLDDVGLDTYHHTFFEMLGNWSFGDYFKKEAIAWSWELIVERFKFPPTRVYASIYQPGPGDPSERDQEAYDLWAEKFRSAGLDPDIHIVNGGKKDNFWMMGETGPCGPCSEIHIDLTPEDRTLEMERRGATLVNGTDARCIEIWNNVFIQFNANPDGTFTPLPAQHVDTGMGFERLTSIIQGTKGFTNFATANISNYETDIFRPIFDELEKMSGKRYASTLPSGQKEPIQGTAGANTGTSKPSSHTAGPITGTDNPSSRAAESSSHTGISSSHAAEPASHTGNPSSRAAEPSSHTGKSASHTAETPSQTPETGQIAIDVAFRVIADHIRTLSFAIADGIQPGNTDRNYVLRRILRRAVRYGRTLGFREPFFYKLTAVLARTMGDVFPEIRAKQKLVEETLKREEEAFNKTLDKGIALFEAEADRITGRAAMTNDLRGVAPAPSRAGSGALAGTAKAEGARYHRRRDLPHFERPWAKYAITFTTHNRRAFSETERDEVMRSILHGHDHGQYTLYAAVVMPDHAHALFEPRVKENDADGNPIFWPLAEIMQGIKSSTAHRINKARGEKGTVWEKESYDRYMRSDSELEEKFLYLCDNPRRAGIVADDAAYPWVWTWEMIREGRTWFPRFEEHPPAPLREESAAAKGTVAHAPSRAVERAPAFNSAITGAAADQMGAVRSEGVSAGAPKPAREGAGATRGTPPAMGTAAVISGAFAFRLYDEQGFPLDLTQLMARERGLTVDVEGPEGFDFFMAQQKARARAAQKKQVIELSEVETKEPTKFVGYDSLSTPAKVLEVVSLKDRTAVILDTTTAYAEMGGQVGDSGGITHGADVWPIANTTKSGHTWLHWLDKERESPTRGVEDADQRSALLASGTEVTLTVDRTRRHAIQRHHTVTHLLHWALHEVVSKEATQKGSFVGPDKLTFDFNSAALTPAQVRDIERLVNERIVENSRVAWIEVPYAEVRGRADVMQFFGDKYGETVRVVQVGGHIDGNGRPALDGYSMELCAGTHTRATGEIGLFRINAEAAIAAGVRRIEAVAGLTAYDAATADMQRLHTLAVNLGTPLPELEKRIEGMLAQHKELEKALKSAQQREAAGRSKDFIAKAETINGIPAIIANLGALDADAAVALAEALKGSFPGVVVLGTTGAGSVALIASVGKEHQAKVQAGKIIQAIAPIVGGKGGGKPDFARGGGKDASKLDEALAKAKAML